jgi:hypothetical protein
MTRIHLETPQALWLLVVILPLTVAMVWRSRSDSTWKGRTFVATVRGLWLCLAVVALSGPWIERMRVEAVSTRVVILRDASLSVRDDSETIANHARGLISALPHGAITTEMEFASSPWFREQSSRSRTETNIEAAINAANGETLSSPCTHLVLLSDGRSTQGDAVEAARQAAARGAKVHVIPVGRRSYDQIRIVSIEPPAQARAGTPAFVRITLESSVPDDSIATGSSGTGVDLRLLDSQGNTIDSRFLPLRGRKTAMMHFTPDASGVKQYKIAARATSTAVVRGEERPLAVYVDGPPRILMSDRFPTECAALQAALAPLNLPIDVVAPDQWPADLAPYAAVVLSDFSGDELNKVERDALQHFVEFQGGGLVFVGGSNVLSRNAESFTQLSFATRHRD